jgi:hypothetical protein
VGKGFRYYENIMDHFYVTLPSDSSEHYFPQNTIANFGTKLATPIELEPHMWEVGLIEISYPKGYRKQAKYNVLKLDSREIKFPVRHELFTVLTRYFKSPEKERFITNFIIHLNKYKIPPGYSKEILGVCFGQNSLQIDERVFSHFPTRVYHGVEDLSKTIMAPANCRGTRVSLPDFHNTDFTVSEPIYVYTDIIKPNLVGDSYVRLLTPLHFTSPTWIHRFDYHLYRPVEQSYIKSIGIRLVTKTGNDVAFDDSEIPCLTILHFKKKHSA